MMQKRGKIIGALLLCLAGAAGLLWYQQAPSQAHPQPVVVKPARVEKAKAPAARPQPERDSGFKVKRILQIDGPFRHGDYVWDDKGVPDGPIVITVDLAAQVLSIFRDGYEIGAAVILYGDDDKPTPLGHFRISEKDADHVSNLYGAPMPYMLRLTNDGITIHGSEVEAFYASHGCIGVPTPFAKKLFAATRLGDLVIITDGKRLDLGADILRN